jgi:iron complex outermembrane receptor protein
MKSTILSFTIILIFSITIFAQNTEKKDSLKSKQLEGVTVMAYRNIYKVDSSAYVSKLPLKDVENPQVYNTISKAVLKDQIVTNFNNALKNATGITRLWESTGRGGDGAEYYTMRGFAVQPTMINGVVNINNGALDPANMENIEVIKGPSGTLFGGNVISYGGLINIVTKKPYEKSGGEFGYIIGSFGLNRLTADVNVPLNNNTFLRVNSSYHSENSFQDAGFNKSFFIAPSLKFVANEKLTFLINTEIKSTESANAPMFFLSRNNKLSFNSIDIFKNNYEKSYTSNALTIKNPNFGMQAQAVYKINKNWTSLTILSRGVSKNDGYYQYLMDAGDGNNFTRLISKRNGETQTTNIQQNFIGEQNFGQIRNRVIIGFDYMNKQIDNGSTGWVANGKVSVLNQKDSGSITPQGVDALLVNSAEAVSSAKTNISSAYISDIINFTPAISAMLSLRIDNFSGRPNYWTNKEVKSQTTVSPKLGLVYQPILNKISLFLNYMNGFVNLDPAEVSDINGQNPTIKVFDPERANQWEIGTKANVFKDKISLTLSYYDISVSNKLMTDPGNPKNQIQGGEVKSKGVEFSMVTSPIQGLSIITGFSKNLCEVTKDAEAAGYLGLRPESAGPENIVNFWANYRIQTGVLENWGLGLQINSASEQKTLNRANVGTFTLPSYTVLSSVISYTGANYAINFKVDNITDQKYFSGWSTVTPQRPRNISLGINYKF